MGKREGDPVCPKPNCGGTGIYIKGWDLPVRRQRRGGTTGEMETVKGKVTRISLYKCRKCHRFFRKAGGKKNEKT